MVEGINLEGASAVLFDDRRFSMPSWHVNVARLFLRWVSTPILAFLLAIVLGNPLRHPEQPELSLQIVPFVALSLAWHYSARKRSRRPV
jgi:hypothetical protein